MGQRIDFPFSLSHLPEYSIQELEFEILLPNRKRTLGIGITTRCNFSCPMCYYHSDNTPYASPLDFPIERLQYLLNNIGPLSSVAFGLQGEPFCHPHIFTALDCAMERAANLIVVSNGSLLTQTTINRLQLYTFSQFFLSVDAGDPNTYSFMRRGGDFHTFKNHALLLTEALGDCVQFHTVICQQNLHSLPQLPKIAAQTGIKSISLEQVRIHPYAHQNGISFADGLELKYMLLNLLENAEKYGIQLQFSEFFSDVEIRQWLMSHAGEKHFIHKPLNGICPQPWMYTSLLANGSLFHCCGDFGPIAVQSLTFDGIFNHPSMLRLRAALRKGHIIPACQNCRQ